MYPLSYRLRTSWSVSSAAQSLRHPTHDTESIKLITFNRNADGENYNDCHGRHYSFHSSIGPLIGSWSCNVGPHDGNQWCGLDKTTVQVEIGILFIGYFCRSDAGLFHSNAKFCCEIHTDA